MQSLDRKSSAHSANGKEDIDEYDTGYPIYGIDWSNYEDVNKGQRVAVSSFIEDCKNSIEVLKYTEKKPFFSPQLIYDTIYPPTKLMWRPYKEGPRTDLLATSGDYIRVYQIDDDNTEISLQAILNKSTNKDRCSPLTSFDWNGVNDNVIGACSIDTTCTVWDLETQKAQYRIVAHDREVFDMEFSHNNADVFITCSIDGSIRLFDLRAMEHSSIIYESRDRVPVLRVSWSSLSSTLIAAVQMDCKTVPIIDIRKPSNSLMMLEGHSCAVNAVQWSPNKQGFLCSVSDDKNCFIWNTKEYQPTKPGPKLYYSSKHELSNLQWSKMQPDLISLCAGSLIHMCHF